MLRLMNLGSTLRFEAGSWQEAIYEVLSGIITGAGHVLYFVLKLVFEQPIYFLTGMRILGDNKPQFQNKGEGELKVVGIGFGRTGTYSVTLALEELGYPTLHTQHLYENEDIFQMWIDNVLQPSLDKGHAELGQPDFDIITQHGYQATMDFPTALYYEKILQEFPNCKFILTTRENSEVWFKSWDTLAKSITPAANVGGTFISGVAQYSLYLRWLFAMVNKDDEFLTSLEALQNQDHDVAIQSYETHNQRVKELIPPDQLLEYSVNDGWQPLCDFLQVPTCPTVPFPKTNSARSVQVQSVASTVVFPLMIAFGVIFFFFTKVFKRATGKTVFEWINQQANLLQTKLKLSILVRNRSPKAKDQCKRLDEDVKSV